MKFDSHYLFSAKYAQWVAAIPICFFSLLIFWQCSTLMFFLPVVPSEVVAESPVPSVARKDVFSSILKVPLFGVYVANNLDEGRVKQSMLHVTVVGVLFADTVADSQVIIRSASGEEKTYKAGDLIPGDALIKRITAEGVVLERQGALERLSLPKSELTFEPVAKPLEEE